ncbi:MAG TPA: MgtC/SapB family protein [Polyangia bacterium]|jgi:putative Mg2+ transporter-C (MgtC) family protein
MTFVTLGWHDLRVLLLSIVASYLLAVPLGWERKAKSTAYVGLRVFPLVAVSSCVYVILAQHVFTGADSKEQSDVLQGLMTGIGFIGAGAIVKEADEAHGVATAAAIWTTAAIGAAVGYAYWALAVALCLVSLVILDVMPWVGGHARRTIKALRPSAKEP